MSSKINQQQIYLIKTIVITLYVALFALFVILMVSSADAKTVTYGTAVEQIRIKHGGPTIFRFPKAVQTITGASRLQIKPANDADPSYTVLAVTPRFTNGVNEVSFFLTDGSVIKTKILVNPNDPAADGIYDFKSKDSLDSTDSEKAPILSEVELLKAMVRDDEVSGYKVSRVSSEVPSKQITTNVELIRIYKGSPFNGYVFRITNTSRKKNIDIDVRHLTVGNPNLAILSQSDDSMLFPEGKGVNQTLVRVVAKNTASSRDVILAMESEETQVSGGATSKKGD